MKHLITLLIAWPLMAGAQKSFEGLVAAERHFSATSMEQGTHNAFMGSLDSAQGLIFVKGEPVSAYTYWKVQQKASGNLNWWPEVAEVSRGNDFGYTTGPWVYTSPGADNRVEASGRYITVWHFVNGQWKFLADLGVNNIRPEASREPRNDKKSAGIFAPDSTSLLKADNDFNKIFTTAPGIGYKQYLSTRSIVNRNDASAATGKPAQDKLIAADDASIVLQNLGYGLAPAGDMAYTYGHATYKGKTDSYLRVWRRERDGWKIAVDVLRY